MDTSLTDIIEALEYDAESMNSILLFAKKVN